ncbi:MAG: hypothetical protein ACTS5I_16970 [Rhodanobacter sp.]
MIWLGIGLIVIVVAALLYRYVVLPWMVDSLAKEGRRHAERDER